MNTQKHAVGANGLIAFNSPLYLRRMARELSNRSAGFYFGGERWTQASYSQGSLRISRTTGWSQNAAGREVHHTESKTFADLSAVVFGDGNGGTIVAGRHAA